MKFQQIINDILVLKNRQLSAEERQDVVDEIHRINDLLKPLGIAKYGKEMLNFQSDATMVEILYQQYQLFALKSLNPPQDAQNNSISFVIF